MSENINLSNSLELLERLSPREREIITMVAQGMSNQSIGQKLFISDKTVKNYVTSIRRKLGLENRIQIALYAIKCGLVKLDN